MSWSISVVVVLTMVGYWPMRRLSTFSWVVGIEEQYEFKDLFLLC